MVKLVTLLTMLAVSCTCVVSLPSSSYMSVTLPAGGVRARGTRPTQHVMRLRGGLAGCLPCYNR